MINSLGHLWRDDSPAHLYQAFPIRQLLPDESKAPKKRQPLVAELDDEEQLQVLSDGLSRSY